MDSEDTSKKSTSIEIIFMKYGDQDQAIMTLNEICKFHINPSKKCYAYSREISRGMKRFLISNFQMLCLLQWSNCLCCLSAAEL